MQEQGKRLLLAVALALGVMMLWQVIFPPKKDEPAPTTGSGSGSAVQKQTTVPTSHVGETDQPATTATPNTPTPAGPVAPATPRSAEQVIELKYPSFVATFSSYGGTLTGWRLTDSRYERDGTKGQLLVGTAAERKERDAKLAALDTGSFDVNFSDSTYVVPKNAEWTGTKVDDRTVKYAFTSDALDIEKTFVVEPTRYMVRMTVKITVKVPEGKEAHQQLAIRACEIGMTLFMSHKQTVCSF